MPAPTPGLQSISDLTTTSRITTGDIPPPLVGATMTIVDDKLFLFGGRLIQNRQMTNSIFVLNLNDFHWQNVSDIVNVAPKRAIGDPGAEDENEMGVPPTERYFHSANAYKNTIVIFGGMGPSSSGSAEGQPQDLVVFDDIKILDLEHLQWRQVRIPSSPHAPKPRYAHLSSVSGNKLVIIGGQDINNQYIEEVSVLDLDSLQWIASMPFEKHCGSYRSIAVSGSGKGSFMPLIGGEAESQSPTPSPTSVTSDGFPTSYLRKTPSNTSLHYTPSLRRSSSNLALSKKGAHMSRLSIGSGGLATSPPTSDARTSVYRLSLSMTGAPPVQQEENPVYIYSNFNFTDVKRELQVLTPPGFVTQDHSHSMTGNVLPPGLRFPTGAIAGQHLLLSGTYLTNAHQSFSIWSLNLSSLAWTRIDTGTVFSTGSWNRGLLLENSNAYLVFGNKSRSLADDYQNRQTNFEHVSIVDLEAFGIYQHPPTTMTQTAQELGLSLLNDPSMADFEILTQDDQRIPVNSAILSARWPYFGALMREQEEKEAAQCKTDNTEHDPTLSTKKTLSLPEPYTVVLAFLQYLYTDHLVTAQQHHSQVLSQLLLLADMYGLDRLRDLATHALHQMLNMSTAAMVYETAALSQQIGLQIRSLKVMIAAKKMLQQQQLKLQQQQALSQSISANAWNSTEPYHPNGGAGGDDHSHYSPYNSSNVGGGLAPPYMSQQHNIHGLFQPNPPPPLSPTSTNGPPSPDYNRLSMQGSTALPHPMLRNRGSVIGTMPPQHWNTEPLTPPPVSPPPPAAAVPSTPPTTTKSSFFSFPGSKNKSNAASSGASTRSGSSTNTKRGVPAFASMGVSPITGLHSDAGSVKSGKSGSGSEHGDKKKPDEAAKKEVIQKLMDTSFLSMGGAGVGGGAMMGPFGGR
ncbi:hypothetical protein BGZ96_007731 [Linnemannia gamsii]|uniref:BTB domain-containing protein n=1 Tax=Linnemannia gamsii TaxID=64522 RepID=A0ABQ7K1A8_9FUNG|nr:hypothetical protein BGZ96_007731 [Linnemannia gamsii]